MTSGLLKSLRKKEDLYKKCMRTNGTVSDRYKEYDRVYKKLCRTAKISYFEQEFEENVKNGKKNLGNY